MVGTCAKGLVEYSGVAEWYLTEHPKKPRSRKSFTLSPHIETVCCR
jgi:hypothetical protein